MKLRRTPISITKFSYDRTTRTFVAEASDLTGTNFLNRIYDDALDIGFVMKSVVTGNEVLYLLEDEHKREGEVTHWTFKPSLESTNKYREAVNTKVTIFNVWPGLPSLKIIVDTSTISDRFVS